MQAKTHYLGKAESLKKLISTFALTLAVITTMSSSAAPRVEPPIVKPVVQSRASLITPDVLAQIDAPISQTVKSADPIQVQDVKTIDDVRDWVYQTCPAVKIATIPGKASYYLATHSAIAVGTETESKYLPFVITHELSHHYQWTEMNEDLKLWNKGLSSKNGLPPVEIQADYMTFEVLGFQPEIANYAKTVASPEARSEAIRVAKIGKSLGC